MNALTSGLDNYAMVPSAVYTEIKLVKLAREIAMDIKELDEVLKIHDITHADFEKLKTNERFKAILTAEIVAWHGAINTNERVRVKAASMIEEWLPELYSRLNDRGEGLSSKIEGGKLLERLAGMGAAAAKNEAPTDRVSITINLGADNKLEFNKRLPAKVIEHEEVFEDASPD